MKSWYLIAIAVLVVAGCSVYSETNSGLENKDEHEYGPVPNAMIDATMVVFHGEDHGTLGGANAIVGDIDGDGVDDFVLLDGGGSATNSPGFEDVRGAVYVFYGRTSYKKEMSVLEADAILRGASNFVAGVGDVDGDGLNDFAFIGEHLVDHIDPGYPYTPGAHLVYGSSERLSGQHLASDVGVHITSGFSSSLYPELFSVHGAGDVNGDGLDDVLVEIRTEGYNANQRVYSYLVLGSRERLPKSYSLDDAQAVFEGSKDGYFVEHGSAPAGDINGDGYSDVLVSTRNTEWDWRVNLHYGGENKFSGSIPPGEADAVFAMESLWTTVGRLGDLDGDGLDDFTVARDWAVPVLYGRDRKLSGTLTESDFEFVIKPEGAPSYMAGLGVGDVDADGNPDIVIGDPHQNKNGMQTGALYLVLGADHRFSDQHNLGETHALLYGKSFQETGDGLGEDLGYGVSSGGDVDGDGYHDILAGAPGDVVGDRYGGTVYLIFGGPRKL
jgi:hypothetical protein